MMQGNPCYAGMTRIFIYFAAFLMNIVGCAVLYLKEANVILISLILHIIILNINKSSPDAAVCIVIIY